MELLREGADLVGTRSLQRVGNSQRSHSAVEKLNWLLRYLETVKAWVHDSSGTGCGSLETMQRRRAQQRNRSCIVGSSESDRIEKTRHIELKAFFLEQWGARPGMRLVQVKTDEMIADCPTQVQSTPNSIHLSRRGLEIEPTPALF